MIIEESEVRARLVQALKTYRVDPVRLLSLLSGVSRRIKSDIGDTPGPLCPSTEWVQARDAQQPIEDLATMLAEMKELEMF